MFYSLIAVMEIICFLFALISLRNTNEIAWIMMKWFMLFTVLIELASNILGPVLHRHNLWLYNLYTPVEFLLLSWVLYRLMPGDKRNLQLLICGIVIFSLTFIFEMCSKGFFASCSVSSTVSDLYLFFICNWYFYLLLKQDEWIEIQKYAPFWLVTGLFLYTLCVIVTDLFDAPLMTLFIASKIPLKYVLYFVFNLILYGCWSFAFVCKYQETI